MNTIQCLWYMLLSIDTTLGNYLLAVLPRNKNTLHHTSIHASSVHMAFMYIISIRFWDPYSEVPLLWQPSELENLTWSMWPLNIHTICVNNIVFGSQLMGLEVQLLQWPPPMGLVTPCCRSALCYLVRAVMCTHSKGFVTHPGNF